MGQSLTHLLVHAIFSTKDRPPFLRSEEIRNEIYAYMAGTLKNLDCHPIKIGGIEDHVHVFSTLSKNIAFSDLIGRLEGSFIKAPQREGAPWLWVAEWIRCLLRQRVQRGIGHGLYPQPGRAS